MKFVLATLLIFATLPVEAGIFRRRSRGYSYSPQYAQRPAAQPIAPVAVESAAALETQIVAETNRVRQRHGLRALLLDGRLLGTARAHGGWMARARSMTHGNHGVAENIAMGQRSASEVVGDWYTSPGHRANMLNPNHSVMGASAYTASDGTIFWVQQFR